MTDTSSGGQGHSLTWLAVIVTFLLQIPGLAIGFAVAYLYRSFLASMLTWNPYDWLTQGWFSKIVLTYFPAMLSGAIAGGFAIYVTSRILRRANYEIVMYATSAVVVALTGLSLFGNLSRYGISLNTLGIAANSLGIVIGLYVSYIGIKEETGMR